MWCKVLMESSSSPSHIHNRASAGPWQEAGPPGRRHQTVRSNGPYETGSHIDSGEEAELIMCDGEMKIHPKVERIGDRCSVYPKTSPSSLSANSSISRGWTRWKRKVFSLFYMRRLCLPPGLKVEAGSIKEELDIWRLWLPSYVFIALSSFPFPFPFISLSLSPPAPRPPSPAHKNTLHHQSFWLEGPVFFWGHGRSMLTPRCNHLRNKISIF